MAVPLRTKHEIVGVLLLGAAGGRESYTTEDKQVLQQRGGCFRADDRERAAERRARWSRRNCGATSRWPRKSSGGCCRRALHAAGSATLAAFSLPARTVGGDYYDFLDLPGDGMAVAVADVSGKGIAAALLMSVVQASLRVICAEGELPSVEPGREDERLSVPLDRHEQVRDVLLCRRSRRRPAPALRQRRAQSAVPRAPDGGRRRDHGADRGRHGARHVPGSRV